MLEIGVMKSFFLISSLFLFQFVSFIQSSHPCPINCICSSLDDSSISAVCNQFPPIKELNDDLHVLKIESSEVCPISKRLQQFTQLKALSVSNCAIEVNSNNFKNLLHLESVTFHNTRIFNFDPSLFEFNQNLKSVNLSSNPLTIWRHVLVSASVEEIDLSNCGLNEIPKKAFSQILNLKRLILKDNRLKTLNIILPDSINFVDLSNNIFQDLSLRALKPLVNLKEIEIFGNPLVCSCKLKLIEKFLSFKNVFIAKPIECIAPRKEIILLETLSLRDVCKLRANLDEDVFVAKLLQRLRRSIVATNYSFEESVMKSETQSIDSKGESPENFTESAHFLQAKMNFNDGDDRMVMDQGVIPDASEFSPKSKLPAKVEDAKIVLDQGFIPDAPEVPLGVIVTPPPIFPPAPELPTSELEGPAPAPERPDSLPELSAPEPEPEPMSQPSPEPDAPVFSLRIVIIILALVITVLLLLVIAIVVALILKMLSAVSNDDCKSPAFQESGDNEEGSAIPMLSRRCSTRKGTCRICPSTMSSRRSERSCKYSQNGEISDCETVANESQFDCATSGNVTSACTTFERSRRC